MFYQEDIYNITVESDFPKEKREEISISKKFKANIDDFI